MKNFGEPMAALDSTNFDTRYASVVSHGPVPIDGLVGSPQAEHILDWSNSVRKGTEATRDTVVQLWLPARMPGMPRIASMEQSNWPGSAVSVIIAPAMRDFERCPRYGHDLSLSVLAAPGLAETPAALGISLHIPSEAASAVHSGVR